MLDRRVRILDLDHSVTSQAEFAHVPAADVVGFDGVASAARLWASESQRDVIRSRIASSRRHWPTLIGSGDYHYVSALLLEQFAEPLTLVVFDHHPDWDRLPPAYGCGAWINRALELPHVRGVVSVGLGSDDLCLPGSVTGNHRAIEDGRLRLLPWRLPRGRLWPWNSLPAWELHPEPDEVFGAALQDLPTRKVYVSIDKDCLKSAYALTNWEEGNLELDFLIRCLRRLAAKAEILGLDITGEFSPVDIPGWWKGLCARIDHPADFSARGKSAQEIARINGATNARILDALR